LPVTRKHFACAATVSQRGTDARCRSRVNEVMTQVLTRVGAIKHCGEEPRRLVGQAEGAAHEAADQRKMPPVAL
jgi:hypothetical protein